VLDFPLLVKKHMMQKGKRNRMKISMSRSRILEIIEEEIYNVLLEVSRRGFLGQLGKGLGAAALASCIGPGCDFGGEDPTVGESVNVNFINSVGSNVEVFLNDSPMSSFLVGAPGEQPRPDRPDWTRSSDGRNSIIPSREEWRSVKLEPKFYTLIVRGPSRDGGSIVALASSDLDLTTGVKSQDVRIQGELDSVRIHVAASSTPTQYDEPLDI